MIFWKGNKIYDILIQSVCPECIYFDYTHKGYLKDKFPRGFTRYYAFVHRNRILISEYLSPRIKVINKKKAKRPIEIIDFVDENSETFPEKFAIRTKNIDLLRRLISMGKKITWVEPDIYTQAHYLGILNFDHVFIDPYINTHVVYPTGEVVPAKNALSYNKGLRSFKIKFMKKLGFVPYALYSRINWNGYKKARWKNKKKYAGIFGFIGKEMAVNLYNVLSITYLIWQRSKLNVMTVKEKLVHKE